MANKLYLVTGLGHCGTKWLAQAMRGASPRLESVHEAAKNWSPRTPRKRQWKLNALRAIEHGLTGKYFDYYFERMARTLKTRDVLDSHSWMAADVPAVADRLPVAGVVHLVRDGVQNVNSLYALYGKRGNWFTGVIERETGYNGGDMFTAWCTWWNHNWCTVAGLLSEGLPVKMLRLEDLTTRPGDLVGLARWMGVQMSEQHARAAQGRDVGRHSKGNRDPVHLWRSWSDAQREIFTAVCKVEMERFDYWRREYD